MIAGLVLAALGAYGVYYFSAKSDRLRGQQAEVAVQSVDSRIVDLLARQSALQARLASVERKAVEKPPVPVFLPAPNLPAIEQPAPPPPAMPVFATPPPATPRPSIEPPRPMLAEVLPPVGEGPLEDPLHLEPALPEKTKLEPPKPLFMPPPPLATPPLGMAALATSRPAPPVPAVPIPEAPPPATPPAQQAPTQSEMRARLSEKPAPGLRSYGYSSIQVEKLIERLRLHPHGAVAIRVPAGNDDALKFAQALQQAFVAAEWHVPPVKAIATSREASGIVLSSGTFPPPVEVTTIFSALVTAGIQLSTDLDPSQPSQTAVLFVGSKP
jgi:hypothetical protein